MIERPEGVSGIWWARRDRGTGQPGIWHAWRLGGPDEGSTSICFRLRLDSRNVHGAMQQPPHAGDAQCRWCLRALAGKPVRAPTPAQPPMPPNTAEVEEMLVEFIGGLYDGTRFKAMVVVESATQFRIIAAPYEKRFKPMRSSEVAQKEPWQA